MYLILFIRMIIVTFFRQNSQKWSQLKVCGFVVGWVFLQWNGQRSLLEGEELFKDKWMFKSLGASAMIELVFLLLSISFDDFRVVTENTEGISIILALHLLSSAMMNYFDTVPFSHRGTDFSPMLVPLLVILCSRICKENRTMKKYIPGSLLLSFGALLVTIGVSKRLSILRIDYLSFFAIFLNTLKLFCLKNLCDKNVNIRLRSSALPLLFACALILVGSLEFMGQSDLGTFFLVSSISSVASIGMLNLIYNHLLPTRTVLEVANTLMVGYLLYQVIEGEEFVIIPVLIGIILMIVYFTLLAPNQEEATPTFKGK